MLNRDFIAKWVEKYRETEAESDAISFMGRDGKSEEPDIRNFSTIKKVLRDRGYLTRIDLEGISEFKSGRRNINNVNENTEEEINSITKDVIESLSTEDTAYLIKELVKLRGVGVKTASAVLTVLEPETFAVLDYRAVRALVWKIGQAQSYEVFYRSLEVFRDPSAEDYQWYNEKLNCIAKETDTTPRMVDMALWKFDKEVGYE